MPHGTYENSASAKTDTARVILYAEDDIDDRFYFERACRTLFKDFVFRYVNDGEEARDYLLARGYYRDTIAFPRPDAVITDLRMPRLNGLEFLRWARTQPAFEQLPIFVFSSLHGLADVQEMQRYAMTGFFKKPRDSRSWVSVVQQMVAVIRVHLDDRTHQRAA